MKVYDASGSVAAAVKQFKLDSEGMPELIPTGFPQVDSVLGGVGPGSCAILGASTGVGKSSAMLIGALRSSVPVGIVSLEDTRDILGARLLAAATGINSLNIRTKDLDQSQLSRLLGAKLPEHMRFCYPIAGSIEQVEEAIQALTEAGCRMIWVDYIQEVRGHREDRRNEVAEALTRAHRAAAKGDAALVAISQFHRLDPAKKPGIHNLAESGDLERKARLIILAWKVDCQVDEKHEQRVQLYVAKSNYGGEGIRWQMRRDGSGTLRDVSYLNPGEEW